MSDTPPLFDQFAGGYEAALQEGLKLTGESPAYFAECRVAWMRKRLAALNIVPTRVLDFGCGTGGSIPYLLTLNGVEQIIGVDVSDASLDVARQKHRDTRVQFLNASAFNETESIDFAFCNGVFHHIPVGDRAGCVKYIHNLLKPQGRFALWENNPWNPAVRYIMSRVSFDRDAIMLSPNQSRALLRENQFQTEAADFLFIFPRSLRLLRPLESAATRLPLGGQYVVMGRKNFAT